MNLQVVVLCGLVLSGVSGEEEPKGDKKPRSTMDMEASASSAVGGDGVKDRSGGWMGIAPAESQTHEVSIGAGHNSGSWTPSVGGSYGGGDVGASYGSGGVSGSYGGGAVSESYGAGAISGSYGGGAVSESYGAGAISGSYGGGAADSYGSYGGGSGAGAIPWSQVVNDAGAYGSGLGAGAYGSGSHAGAYGGTLGGVSAGGWNPSPYDSSAGFSSYSGGLDNSIGHGTGGASQHISQTAHMSSAELQHQLSSLNELLESLKSSLATSLTPSPLMYFPVPSAPLVHEKTEYHKVPVNKFIKVPTPFQVPVLQPVPITIPQPFTIKIPVPVPVEKTVHIPIEKTVPYPVEKPVPVKVVKKIPVPVEKPYPVPVPVYKTKYIHYGIKSHH